MEKSTLLGIVLGIIAVVVGMILKHASPSALLNPAAFMIIIVGTVAALMNAFPLSEIKRIPALFKILFTEQKLPSKRELIDQFMNWASIARREGLLALENTSDEIEDPFLKNGMKMIIDGGEPEFVRDVLNEEIYAIEERHQSGALIFSQAGSYAPTLGVLGAVVGLIAALGNLSDIDALGVSIAAAFVATLLGIFTGYVLWHPFATKLKRKSKREIEIKKIMVEGLLSIQAGVSPAAIEQKLLVYIPLQERAAVKEEKKEEEAAVNG
ncbi:MULTISPECIES: flagellar motor stator protein MotA [Brevibacillus]|jgi:chemotaxis protein MotA|uniref:Flagellar motor protein MotA n=1 Tax=Brevibacillus borstelensis AK1 TaxID=1300222 RepID=M8DUH5_9BACL|nr:flagellar motor stator protein MotA [Brevibacillus borstelensis]EMT50611.1 flagellar motor protein MotA [Brevibacillus borstelensis AK1]KKX56228.1 flagellar motor protein MotA [Brevibacillus borstelensis cifa_chp40]MBE5395460.1 flagellar motor stator protein MotA [Brevibacillus borstelensis]MCC0564613.1 flagellar motor stator protein MotA [Brevibacillus borstelensis]MCM3558080.1 flagellar motor stator protein MotA [Brevibacillus borstelensis]